jgi:hypothetical protein
MSKRATVFKLQERKAYMLAEKEGVDKEGRLSMLS